MTLVERHIIKKTDKRWKQCDELCFKSKNLYNQALYRIKKYHEETGKTLGYHKLDKQLKSENQFDYRELNGAVSQQTLMLLDKNIKSFFSLMRKWKANKKILSGCPQFPKYKHKVKGRNVLVMYVSPIKNGYIRFPKKTGLLPLRTKVEKVQQVRIVPMTSCYVIEVLYYREPVDRNLNKENYISIDLGINNLASISSNSPGIKPFIVNGKIVKSINQYYNKKNSKLKSQVKKNHNKNSSNRLNRLSLKRDNQLHNYFHNTSKLIIDFCIKNDIGNIVIGHNIGWKQEVNLGKVFNQKFTQIPFTMLINQLKYKGELNDITVIETEESYTSKIDHLALETLGKQDSYLGKRVKRGLFQSSTGKKINADINGSIGILRKVISDGFLADSGLVFSPVKVNPLQTNLVG